MIAEAGRLYITSQYLTTNEDKLGPMFPAICGRRKPDLRSEGLTRLDAAEVPDLYEELAELARMKWRCPNDGCDKKFEERKELRQHLK